MPNEWIDCGPIDTLGPRIIERASQTVSTAVFDPYVGSEILEPLIVKGTSLPARVSSTYWIPRVAQSALRVHLYVGEDAKLDGRSASIFAEVIIELGLEEEELSLNLHLTTEAHLLVQVVWSESKRTATFQVIKQEIVDPSVEALVRRKAQLESQLLDVLGRLENSFDVFISAKSSDQEKALEVYDYLSERGINAFLSSRSLGSLSNTAYREQIDAALDLCQNMIVFTTSSENIRSPWVEAEWGLFINEKRSGRKKGNIITVIAGDFLIEKLPASLRYYEVVVFGADGLHRLLNYIVR
jgi:TIR domain